RGTRDYDDRGFHKGSVARGIVHLHIRRLRLTRTNHRGPLPISTPSVRLPAPPVAPVEPIPSFNLLLHHRRLTAWGPVAAPETTRTFQEGPRSGTIGGVVSAGYRNP